MSLKKINKITHVSHYSQNGDAKKEFQQRMTNNNTEIFHVAEHVDPSTMGIWLVETDIKLPDGSTVLFMDTEGFFGK